MFSFYGRDPSQEQILFQDQWQDLQGELATERERNRQLLADKESSYRVNCQLRETNEQFAEALEDCASQIQELEEELEFTALMDANLLASLSEDFDFSIIDLSFLIVRAYGRI